MAAQPVKLSQYVAIIWHLVSARHLFHEGAKAPGALFAALCVDVEVLFLWALWAACLSAILQCMRLSCSEDENEG